MSECPICHGDVGLCNYSVDDHIEQLRRTMASRENCGEANTNPTGPSVKATVKPLGYEGAGQTCGTEGKVPPLISGGYCAGIAGLPGNGPQQGLATDAAARKTQPIASGVLDYFPDALAAVAHVSYVGNQQHNPGQPLHWDRSKSTDDADALLRHFLERGKLDSDGCRHSAKMVWRALALLQKEIERDDAPTEKTVMEGRSGKRIVASGAGFRYCDQPRDEAALAPSVEPLGDRTFGGLYNEAEKAVLDKEREAKLQAAQARKQAVDRTVQPVRIVFDGRQEAFVISHLAGRDVPFGIYRLIAERIE